MTGSPPVPPGTKESTPPPSPAVTVRSVGAAGAVAGVTDPASASAPVPAAFTARTRTAYAVPLVRPDTVAVRAFPAPSTTVSGAQVVPPSVETSYRVSGLQPVLAGAVKLRSAEPLPRVAVAAPGAPGVVAAVTAPDSGEAVPSPAALAAVTRNVYVVPAVRPDTVQGLVA